MLPTDTNKHSRKRRDSNSKDSKRNDRKDNDRKHRKIGDSCTPALMKDAFLDISALGGGLNGPTDPSHPLLPTYQRHSALCAPGESTASSTAQRSTAQPGVEWGEVDRGPRSPHNPILIHQQIRSGNRGLLFPLSFCFFFIFSSSNPSDG